MFQTTFLRVSLLLGDGFLQGHTAGLSGFSIAGVQHGVCLASGKVNNIS